MFDLEKSLEKNGLINNRLGKVVDIDTISIPGSEYKILKYTVEMGNGKLMHVDTSLQQVFYFSPIAEVIEAINKLFDEGKISEEKKDSMLETINNYK